MQSQLGIETSHLVLTAGALVVAYAFASFFILPLFSVQGKYFSSQSWIGLKKQWFAKMRGGFATLKNTRSMIVEGYEKYTRHNKIFVLPQFSSEPVIIVSPSQLQELLGHPDDEVDAHKPNSDSIAPKYTIGERFTGGPHIDIVRRQLTRKLPTLTSDVYDELVQAMINNWPANDKAWTSVKAYDTCMKIVSRAANRVFCGTNLCRNPEFLEHSRLFAIAVFKTGGMMKMIPNFLHPVAGPFLNKDVTKHREACKAIALPEIRSRLKHLQSPNKDPNYIIPNDALQWLLEDSIELAKSDPWHLEEDTIVRRLLILNMVAIHTTSMVTTNTLLDLYTSPYKEEYLASLRQECEQALSENGGVWTKNAVNSLLRVDSTIRESMRISTLADLGMRRLVISRNGITLSDGLHIPQGVRVAAPNYAIHTDPAFYPEKPDEWDAFRFSRPREEYLEKVKEGASKEHLEKVLEQKNQALIATGSDWLSFGHGRHSCPGRFFASQEMKLMLAHIVMNYDIKIDGPRPPNMQINGSSIPSADAMLQIQLRQKA